MNNLRYRKGKETLAACLACPPGKFCSRKGAKEPEGDCSAGYICYNGSTVSRPTQDNSTGGYLNFFLVVLQCTIVNKKYLK